jgi:nucleoside 2-deoxyribosyltransferase
MIEIKSPDSSSFERFTKIFLAGSIEMGKAEPWQQTVAEALKDESVILFNPRREDWDSSWSQDPTAGTPFNLQVTWELEHIRKSDLVIFYFDPATQSPITLMELGICLAKDYNILVCCPDGYFRKGNVVIACSHVPNNASVNVLNTLDELIAEIKMRLNFKQETAVNSEDVQESIDTDQ